SRPASRNPLSRPVSHAIPVTPPPPSTSAYVTDVSPPVSPPPGARGTARYHCHHPARCSHDAGGPTAADRRGEAVATQSVTTDTSLLEVECGLDESNVTERLWEVAQLLASP